MSSPPTAAFTSPAGRRNRVPSIFSVPSLIVWRASWVVVLSVSRLRTAAEVRFAAPTFHTSSALAAESGSWVTIRPLAGIDAAVRLPAPLVVPFSAR